MEGHIPHHVGQVPLQLKTHLPSRGRHTPYSSRGVTPKKMETTYPLPTNSQTIKNTTLTPQKN